MFATLQEGAAAVWSSHAREGSLSGETGPYQVSKEPGDVDPPVKPPSGVGLVPVPSSGQCCGLAGWN